MKDLQALMIQCIKQSVCNLCLNYNGSRVSIESKETNMELASYRCVATITAGSKLHPCMHK